MPDYEVSDRENDVPDCPSQADVRLLNSWDMNDALPQRHAFVGEEIDTGADHVVVMVDRLLGRIDGMPVCEL